MGESSSYSSIKNWSEEDRPREKFLKNGRHALSNAELLAILLRSGTFDASALSLAEELLKNAGNDLDELGKMSVNQLMKIKGVGEAKALTLAASLELGRRRKFDHKQEITTINSSEEVFNYYYPILADEPREHFRVLLLRRNNSIIKDFLVSQGGVSGALVDPKLIFKEALESLASSIILVHNHPSGNLSPSSQDKEITQKIQQGGKVLEINVLDHIIFHNKGYFSFADEGLM